MMKARQKMSPEIIYKESNVEIGVVEILIKITYISNNKVIEERNILKEL